MSDREVNCPDDMRSDSQPTRRAVVMLREESEVDTRFGGFLNADIAEYVVPVNADIGAIEVEFIDKPDPLFNSAGVKGVGEVSMVGVAAAIANALHHATGRRLRDLPIRIEHVL
jgi:xanthine dehydrogenase YagR molybdenum-binding subunit